jgi:hypothetical protein
LPARVDLDLLSGKSSPAGKVFAGVAQAYAHRLAGQLAAGRTSAERLISATISIEFSPTGRSEYVYECAITLIDDTGNSRVACAKGSCRPHDPTLETRSTRAS